MPDRSESPDAVRMRRRRRHDSGDHRLCLPSQCQLAYAELRLLRALLEQQPTETSVRFARAASGPADVRPPPERNPDASE